MFQKLTKYYLPFSPLASRVNASLKRIQSARTKQKKKNENKKHAKPTSVSASLTYWQEFFIDFWSPGQLVRINNDASLTGAAVRSPIHPVVCRTASTWIRTWRVDHRAL